MSNFGWKCPGCSACWAPQVKGCELCDPRQKTDKPSLAERAAEQLRHDLARQQDSAAAAAVMSGHGSAGVAKNEPCICYQTPLPESGFCQFHQTGWDIARSKS